MWVFDQQTLRFLAVNNAALAQYGVPERGLYTYDTFDRIADNPDIHAVYIVLLGHGSFDGRNARFNLPGPDMGPADFNAALKALPTKQIVFVNTSSSSGPFVEAMSAPGRTIITATRSGAEQFATLFGGYFIDALASDTADADKNRRVSVLEALVPLGRTICLPAVTRSRARRATRTIGAESGCVPAGRRPMVSTTRSPVTR